MPFVQIRCKILVLHTCTCKITSVSTPVILPIVLWSCCARSNVDINRLLDSKMLKGMMTAKMCRFQCCLLVIDDIINGTTNKLKKMSIDLVAVLRRRAPSGTWSLSLPLSSLQSELEPTFWRGHQPSPPISPLPLCF